MIGSCFFARTALLPLLGLTLAVSASADWLHYRGPTMNGVAGEALPAKLSGTPTELWKTNVGTGTAAITVSGGRAYTMGNPDKAKDAIVCLELKSGKEIWRHEFPLDLDPNLFEGGPRSTPTIDGKVVYTVSHQGDLWALDAATGQKIWYKHLQKDFGGRRPEWGFSGSPTVEGNLLLLDVGGDGTSTVALNKSNGELVWKSGSDKAGYASPVVADLAGRRTVVMFKAEALVGLDLQGGKELWRTPWKTSYDINAATPLIVGDAIFITSGYGTGAAAFEITESGIAQKWRNKSLRAHVNSPVAFQGHLFGVDGNTGGGNLVCLDQQTGEKKWEEKSMKGGSLILAGDKLICLTEKGELVICDASAAGFRPHLRAQVMTKRCWVQPTLTDGHLLVKNNEGDISCLVFGAK